MLDLHITKYLGKQDFNITHRLLKKQIRLVVKLHQASLETDHLQLEFTSQQRLDYGKIKKSSGQNPC